MLKAQKGREVVPAPGGGGDGKRAREDEEDAAEQGASPKRVKGKGKAFFVDRNGVSAGEHPAGSGSSLQPLLEQDDYIQFDTFGDTSSSSDGEDGDEGSDVESDLDEGAGVETGDVLMEIEDLLEGRDRLAPEVANADSDAEDEGRRRREENDD